MVDGRAAASWAAGGWATVGLAADGWAADGWAAGGWATDGWVADGWAADGWWLGLAGRWLKAGGWAADRVGLLAAKAAALSPCGPRCPSSPLRWVIRVRAAALPSQCISIASEAGLRLG